jgi:hypothetical protein
LSEDISKKRNKNKRNPKGAVISQDGKLIAFFSQRLSKAQQNYTTTKKELLSIVECLKQF